MAPSEILSNGESIRQYPKMLENGISNGVSHFNGVHPDEIRSKISSSATNGDHATNGNPVTYSRPKTNGVNVTNGVAPPEPQPIAIVGMSVRLPGNVSTAEEFWELCSRARSGWSPVPKSRFNQEVFYHPNPDKLGCHNANGGHFLREDVGLFDAPFFNVTEKEAIAMDPQQRLILECTYEALENGGIPMRGLVGKDVGVFVGGSFADYELRNCRDIDTAPMYQATGNAQSLLANRISFFFDFAGPSITVDTACSSSLAALHLACQSLRCGESSQAIVASCHLNILPDYFITMSLQNLFSNEGKSFAFDERGNGFGRGEGVGCVVLKPLNEAIKANDSIRAVIVGSGMNQDGRTNGITMPSKAAQIALMKSVYQKNGLDPALAGYIEAHGTGTKVGDPIEASALHQVFCQGDRKNPLFIGSVKSNIGHLEGASGLVSVIKSAMMLEKGFVVPNCDFKRGNSQIRFSEWNLKVPTTQRPWPRDKKYISINNFGFGGTNAHAVLEKAPSMPRAVLPGTNDTIATGTQALANRLYILSANDRTSLEKQMQNLTVYLEQRPEVFQNSLLPDLAYTLGQRRSALNYRVAIPARSSAQLISALAGKDVIPSRAMKDPKIGFIFTGQGAQWHAMGKELLDAYPVFAAAMEKGDRCLLDLGAEFSIIEELSRDVASSRISDAQISQPACTIVQLALTDLLKSWNIHPVAVAGHSSGEIGAAYAAEALSFESCVAVAYYRGQSVVSLKRQFPDLKGAMLAVGGSPEEIRPMIKMLRSGRATIACINSSSSVTVSGDEVAISDLARQIEERQMFNRKLRVDTAYHSHHMALVAEEYNAAMAGLTPSTVSKVIFHSSLRGRVVDAYELDSKYWAENLTCPVRFSDAVHSMYQTVDKSSSPGMDILVEIGPHAALEGPIKQTLKSIGGNATKTCYSSVLFRNKNAVDTALQFSATMAMRGAFVDFGAINFPFPNINAPSLLTNLPKYVWNHSKKYWHESRIAQQHTSRQFPRNDIVGSLATYSNDLEPTWRNIVRADDMPWVRHHRMQDMIVYPMAGFIAMALEASAQRAAMRNVSFDEFKLREITVSRPLVIQEGFDIETQITLRAHAEGTRTSSNTWDEFRILSWTEDRGWTEHCRGLISVHKSSANVVDGAKRKLDEKAMLLSNMVAITAACKSDVNTKKLYKSLEDVGVGYGPSFQGLERCRAGEQHAMADLIIPDTASLMPTSHETDFIIHPAFLDQFIQIVWPILGAGWKGLDVLYMPSFVQAMSIKTGITRKSGDCLHVFGTGQLTPIKPSPTKLNLFAVMPDSGDETLISMEALIMTPVSNGADAFDAIEHRELCYKIQWEPVVAKPKAIEGANQTIKTNGTHDITTSWDASPDVVIIGHESRQQHLISSVQDLINDITHRYPVAGSLGSTATEGKICIVLLELEHPIVSKLDSTTFQSIQRLFAGVAGVLWVVRGAYTNSQNPNAEMVIGMARSIRSETLLKFATLDLDSSPQLSDSGAAQRIVDVFKSAFAPDAPPLGTDMEYQERHGSLSVPRVVNYPEMNKIVHQEIQQHSALDLQAFAQAGRPLKIAIKTPGALDTIYFTDDLAVGTPIPDFEVEIEVKATSMNFKDIMITMGQLPSKYIGVECAGIISAVGSKVTNLSVGDRVCAMSEGAYSTYTRCLGTSCQKISDEMSFETASTIPVIYCTAYYSLFDLARLSKGESVLIHAAAGGVGQAAIILSKMIGAEIFATVGSTSKKDFLMKEYGIPEDRIFYSRNTSFAKAIQQATSGKGVDVVLNSLAGDALAETWDSLAHFGRFIEIGKRDITGNTRLEMAGFEHNAMFASVDLTIVAAERPQLMERLLSDVFDLMAKGLAKPISPVTIFSLANVESAFRNLQSGKTIGKIVLVPTSDCQVKAVSPKMPKDMLSENATYIIIGGTGGLGRSLSRWMISKGARNIVLLSRSGNSQGKVSELLSEAATLGAQIIVRPCDVTNRESVYKLITEDLGYLPAIKGVIHAAMVLHDVLFENMNFHQWQAVVEPKVAGAWNFHDALLATQNPLDFFVMISSAAGAVGNKGQAAYAAANTFLNAFAQYRLQMGLPASSIDLTAVRDIGYLAENVERQAQVMENLGSETVNEAEVVALVGAAIRGSMNEKETGCSGHCVTGLKLTPDSQDLFWVDDARFVHLKDATKAAADFDPNSLPISTSLSIALKAAKSKKQALQLVCEGLMTKVSSVLMVPIEDMDNSRPIVTYGLDSLVAIEIRNWITRELEASLQVLELLTSSSILALGETILQKSRLANFSDKAIESK